jgi:predicted small lipoprotein YifL
MLINVMKFNHFAFLLAGAILTGCGQPGPLYLPKDKPPANIGPDASEADAEKKAQEKPEPQPQPEILQPSTDTP